jgi:aspartate kinase
MQVFKFGGASVNSVERIKNVGAIVKEFGDENLVIIVSAMGKTTNGLEKVVEAFYNNLPDEALQLFGVIKNQHLTTAKYLLVTQYNACEAQLQEFFTEVEWLLHDKPVREYAYYYDQIICVGELMSTCIVSHFLTETNIVNTWLDVRDVLRTDNNFRDANVDWDYSTKKIMEACTFTSNETKIYITQGFIGATSDNENTTLGREGSDYTAAIFANILQAKNLTIWKDVAAVMNADPKLFNDAVEINQLSYNEVIEMAFYGAQVIHPKTIKPLQNKHIPLQVKCFLDTSLNGTVISNSTVRNLPPIIVQKEKQILVTFTSKDYSFVGQQPMSSLYQWLNLCNIKPTLVQTGAITILLVMDDNDAKVQQLAAMADSIFDIQIQKQLAVLTVRHFTPQSLTSLLQDKEIILQQQTQKTFQALYKI